VKLVLHYYARRSGPVFENDYVSLLIASNMLLLASYLLPQIPAKSVQCMSQWGV
jgi:hypothetical protein